MEQFSIERNTEIKKGERRLHEVGLPTIEDQVVIKFKDFSSVMKLHRVVAWCFRFYRNIKEKSVTKLRDQSLSAVEIAEAKLAIERYVQNQAFEEVRKALIKKRPNEMVAQLGLYLDRKAVIRCNSRLRNADIISEAKNPKLLPRKHPYTTLVVQSIHKMLLHSGVSHCLAQIRYDYWIPQGRRVVSEVLRSCLICRRWEGGPFKVPEVPQLPPSRVTASAPFTYVGLDYFGPMWIKEKKETNKVWACLFTCLTIRAIHIELIRDLTAEQFLMSFRRFVSRRGRPTEILSDNASQFKLANSTIDKLWKKLLQEERVKDYSATCSIKWKFIVEMAPWMGGTYERLIGSVKRALRKTIGYVCLTYDQLSTVLTEVEAVINTRPIVYVGEDIRSGLTLCPADFLSLNPKRGFPDLEYDDDDAEYVPRETSVEKMINIWHKGQKHLSSFWKKWNDEYLLSLKERHSSGLKQGRGICTSNPYEGQVVLVRDTTSLRGNWKVGRIEN